MFEHYVVKLQSPVKRLRELEFQQHSVTPQHAAEGKRTAYLRRRLRREHMTPLTRTGKPLLRFARRGSKGHSRYLTRAPRIASLSRPLR